ncbi:helix-turn-helix domain-containing protein [Kitasatospora cineracea]|uniref:helix-turn-helix domain-containing protein n=1 Tax=Kitasatospora cineracea TaxID=88074 RepID=UPI003684E017
MVDQREIDLTSPPSLRFGAELRRSRRARGWSQSKLGARMGYSNGLVSYVERGKKAVTRNFAVKSDEVFGTGGLFQELWRQLAHSSFLEGFDEFVEAEVRCVRLRAYEMDVVLGIFMTPEYLGALERANVQRGRITREQADDRVARNAQRQQILHRDPSAAVHAVLDESCLRRPIGGTKVMDAQLAHLEGSTDLPNVTHHDPRCSEGSTMKVDLTTAQWVKSSHSVNGGNCVEFAPEFAAAHGLVPVRDSKDPHGPALLSTETAFTAFVTAVKSGCFDMG